MMTWLEKLELNLSRAQIFLIFILDAIIILMIILYGLGENFILFFPLALLGILLVLVNYRLGLYLLLLSLFLRYELYFFGKSFGVIDLVSLILVFSFLGYFLISGNFSIRRTPLDRPIWLFLIVLGFSLLNSVDLLAGIRVYLWHLQVFVIFYLVSWGVGEKQVKRYLVFFLGLIFIHTIISLLQFILAEGKVRSFGLAGPSIADLTIGGLLICYAFYLFEPASKKRFYYSLLFLFLLAGLLVTQTRGALLSFGLIYLLVNLLVLKKGRDLQIRLAKRRALISLALVLLIVAVVLLGFPDLLSRLHHGFYYLPGKYIETTQIRFYLWGLALKSFLHNPFLGIGLGQFYNLVQVFPDLRFSPLVFYIYGLDPHNIILYYLSSAGILGVLSLFYFFISVLKLGWRKYKLSISPQDSAVSLALLGIMLFVFISSFYSGEWFYRVSGVEFLFFVGLLSVFKPGHK